MTDEGLYVVKSAGAATAETVVRRSRFIAYTYPVADEDALRAVLSDLKKEHKFATHIVYGAVFEDNNRVKFSDDGEPGGTAGQPVLEAVKGRGLTQTAVFVVRYFGGVKLGAGGLTRAYAAAATAVLDIAPLIEKAIVEVYEVTLSLSLASKTVNALGARFTLSDIVYGASVRVTLFAPPGSGAEAVITDLTGGQAEVKHIGQSLEVIGTGK